MNKICTSIEQSKKLAEILPIESADMCWCNNSIKGINYTDKFSANLYTVKEMKDVFDEALVGWDKYWELVPCWSLAALLNAVDFSTINLHYDNVRTDWVASATIHDSTKHCTKYESTRALNPIDACYEMILRLHEQKLL